jgi:hypothetical protein
MIVNYGYFYYMPSFSGVRMGRKYRTIFQRSVGPPHNDTLLSFDM